MLDDGCPLCRCRVRRRVSGTSAGRRREPRRLRGTLRRPHRVRSRRVAVRARPLADVESDVAKFPDAVPDALRRHQRQLLRIALQTAAATLAIYLVIDRIAASHLSWAVISALLTIGVSADITYRNAMGRAAAACIGAAIGLVASAAIGGPVILALLPAVVLANMISTLWPSLRYGAVTAAIVALDPDPELASALGRTGAIVAGTLTGAAASFLIWPVRGRDRANLVLRRAIGDCQDLLRLIERGVGTDDRHERDAVHARFLGHLETARSRVRETGSRRT